MSTWRIVRGQLSGLGNALAASLPQQLVASFLLLPRPLPIPAVAPPPTAVGVARRQAPTVGRAPAKGGLANRRVSSRRRPTTSNRQVRSGSPVLPGRRARAAGWVRPA